MSAILTVPAVALLALIGTAAPASAVPADKSRVLSNWTQTSASSYNTFISARNNQGSWSAYDFNWSTDHCSSSPDNPLGFPFNLSCARHDFGYRNYKAAGQFSANKPRLDSMFYEDLKRVCGSHGYSASKKATCNSLAWTYYKAVKQLG
ncbi:phospholipase [Streptomyces sp. H27-G5]|uniref:phospholipase n=1 Tax=Streptomyces sp. H27-G5 TaxID=2996698 RepID=UPI002271CD17|nr:phospholipase [Streptomyces sp. H27-G5]MCY0924544.1 phospholipase [Streptomyces sp. H27-G5]